MPVVTYEEIIEKNYPLCEKCREYLEKSNGTITVSGQGIVQEIRPVLWKHSELDVYHGWILAGERHIFLCGTDEFDEITLKRIRPLKREEINSWNLFINGSMYTVVEGDDSNYEILSEEGTIVKDEEIEARVFNHMMYIRMQ